jgi:hypothetical protein
VADPSRGQVGDLAYVGELQRKRLRRATASQARPRPASDGDGGPKVRKHRDERKLTGASRSRPRPRDVRGDGQDGLVADEREYKEPYRARPRPWTRRPASRAWRRGGGGKKAAAKRLRGGRVPAVPRRRKPRGHLAVAQLHLLFAAFVLAVPIFALHHRGDRLQDRDLRYDRLAHEFTKLLSVSFSLTATFGASLTFMLIILYPKFTNYLMSVFSPTFLPYVLLFFAEAFFLYTYYYGWGKFHRWCISDWDSGSISSGTGIMVIANSWLTFMMSPKGVSTSGALIR